MLIGVQNLGNSEEIRVEDVLKRREKTRGGELVGGKAVISLLHEAITRTFTELTNSLKMPLSLLPFCFYTKFREGE